MARRDTSSVRSGVNKKRGVIGKIGQKNGRGDRMPDERPQNVARSVGHVRPAEPNVDKTFQPQPTETVYQAIPVIELGAHLGTVPMSFEAEQQLRQRRAEASRLAREQRFESSARSLGFGQRFGVSLA